jgi:alpha-glucosidase
MLLLTLRGTPTIYYGEEIGMEDVQIHTDDIQDPAERNEPGLGMGRDPERTPMPWDASQFAGFSSAKPWLPVARDYLSRNVSTQQSDATSILNLYKHLLALRRKTPALVKGTTSDVTANGSILSYQRTDGVECFVITLNLSHEAQNTSHRPAEIVLSTHLDRAGEKIKKDLALRPSEGIIARLVV